MLISRSPSGGPAYHIDYGFGEYIVVKILYHRAFDLYTERPDIRDFACLAYFELDCHSRRCVGGYGLRGILYRGEHPGYKIIVVTSHKQRRLLY